MPKSTLYKAIIRAAKDGNVRRAVAKALFTLLVRAARTYASNNHDRT